MKIGSRKFRVEEGCEVNLKKWPTKVKPVYKSKDQYKKLLEKHVSQLSSQQQLLYADKSPCRSSDLSGHGCGRKRRRYPARDVWR